VALNGMVHEQTGTLCKSSAAAEMGDRLATIDMGRKVGANVPLSVGELGNTLWPGRGQPPYKVAS